MQNGFKVRDKKLFLLLHDNYFPVAVRSQMIGVSLGVNFVMAPLLPRRELVLSFNLFFPPAVKQLVDLSVQRLN